MQKLIVKDLINTFYSVQTKNNVCEVCLCGLTVGLQLNLFWS